jgi:hypothetical protein
MTSALSKPRQAACLKQSLTTTNHTAAKCSKLTRLYHKCRQHRLVKDRVTKQASQETCLVMACGGITYACLKHTWHAQTRHGSHKTAKGFQPSQHQLRESAAPSSFFSTALLASDHVTPVCTMHCFTIADETGGCIKRSCPLTQPNSRAPDTVSLWQRFKLEYSHQTPQCSQVLHHIEARVCKLGASPACTPTAVHWCPEKERSRTCVQLNHAGCTNWQSLEYHTYRLHRQACPGASYGMQNRQYMLPQQCMQPAKMVSETIVAAAVASQSDRHQASGVSQLSC